MKSEDSLPCSQEPAPDPILCQLNPDHTPTTYFFKNDFNIILPCTSRSPNVLFLQAILISSMRTAYCAHLILFPWSL
jgi:hypothetical protein